MVAQQEFFRFFAQQKPQKICLCGHISIACQFCKEFKEFGKTEIKPSYSKDFKIPPVLPIVFYDGATKWTSEINFFDRTYMNDIFAKYIPKFEYELVDLNQYLQDDLVAFNNALSLILITDKVKKAKDIKNFRKLPEDYLKNLENIIPEHLLKIFADCINLLLRKVNVPVEEIEEITEKIYKRRINDMFDFVDGYDVQAMRKEIRVEERVIAQAEAKKEYEERIRQLEEKLKKYE